jgi:pyruvate dehydrogenase E1 component alpha subunit
MLLIRRIEERIAECCGEGRIGGFTHLYIGHEAVVVGDEGVAPAGLLAGNDAA